MDLCFRFVKLLNNILIKRLNLIEIKFYLHFSAAEHSNHNAYLTFFMVDFQYFAHKAFHTAVGNTNCIANVNTKVNCPSFNAETLIPPFPVYIYLPLFELQNCDVLYTEKLFKVKVTKFIPE